MSQGEITIEEVYATMEAMSRPGQLFSYSTREINGIPLRVFDNQPPTMRDYYNFGMQHAKKDFFVTVDERFTFEQVFAHSWRLAKALEDELGIKKGDYVAIAMRNRPEWVFSFMALTAMGAIAVPLNGWWTTAEMEYGLSFCGARHVIADPRRLATLGPLVDKLDIQIIATKVPEDTPGIACTFESLMEKVPHAAPPTTPMEPDDPITLFYTSGSTGKPKGALSSHRAVLTPMMAWGRYALANLRLMEEHGEETLGQTAVLNTVPLFHCTGSHSHLLVSIIAGRKVVSMPKWDVDLAMQLVEREKITSFHGVPTMAKELMDSPNRSKYDLSSILELGSGGAPRPEKEVARQAEALPHVYATIGYGLTETNALGCVNGRNGYLDRPGSSGQPDALLVDCRIVDTAGDDVATGANGEIWLRTSANFICYLNNPEATAAALTNGWFHTGDLGHLDEDGYLYIVDRLKDIIIRGGENISCVEVEGAMANANDIAESSVFGLPDDRLGEVVGAAIYGKDGKAPDVEALKAMLEDHIAQFKIPTRFFISEKPLPRLGTGKIDKRALREKYIIR
jgi:steroid-24-oyl-CoA synthetase